MSFHLLLQLDWQYIDSASQPLDMLILWLSRIFVVLRIRLSRVILCKRFDVETSLAKSNRSPSHTSILPCHQLCIPFAETNTKQVLILITVETISKSKSNCERTRERAIVIARHAKPNEIAEQTNVATSKYLCRTDSVPKATQQTNISSQLW